jgi:hypothetical protein
VIGVSFDDIAPLATLTRVRCPTSQVHWRADGTVPADDAHRLLAVSGCARLLPVDVGHDLPEALAPQSKTLVAFSRTACASPAAGMPDGVAASHAVRLVGARCVASGTHAVADGRLGRVLVGVADGVEQSRQGPSDRG